jgi:7,8-dihydropterin-6-yl-methyl-4-(beta-D-ribofuranosyl)aminobenzene 5'-phosphate synthase
VSFSTRITCLADNTVTELIPDEAFVEHLSEPGRNFLAEHGFSVLVETSSGERVLFDAGATDRAVPHNLELLGLDIARDIDTAVLSHGHSDHAGSIGLLRCPVHAHPEAPGARFIVRNGRARYDLSAPALAFIGDRLTLSSEPEEVAPGVWTTGEIPRENGWEVPEGFARIRGETLESDPINDDQGLAIVTPQGLVVITGCAHAGVLNTVEQARRVTGVDRIHAIIGGFHLIGAEPAKVRRTIAGIRKIAPKVLAANHCTGLRSTAELLTEFPESFVAFTAGHRLTVPE